MTTSVCQDEQQHHVVKSNDEDGYVGRMKSADLGIKKQKPGAKYVKSGEGEVCGVGEGPQVPDGGDEVAHTEAQLKTKPKRVGGGGLSAKIHLWEMKSGGLHDENYSDRRATENSSAGTSYVFSDRKWKTAPLEQHGQD